MNSILKFLSLLLCIWILSPCSHADIPSVDSVFSLHRHPVINKINNWKEIDLVYENRLLHSRNDNSKTSAGCVSSYNTAAKILFRCKEHIMLLRPDKVIKHWLKEQRQAGYINLTIKEFGLTNTRAYISAIKPASISQKCYLQLFSKSNKTNYSTESSCVTGVFKRHVDDVNSYTFKNLFTGNTETIHATPDHLFYVKNRGGFMALDEITSTDELLNLSGHQMRLLCPKGKKKHCGMIWKKFNISAVYNLEVYKEHEYFAGNNEIYVHNVYICTTCNEQFDTPKLLQKHIKREHQAGTDITPINSFHALLIQKDKELELITEKQNVKNIMEIYKYRCDQCPGAFCRYPNDLFKHQQVQHGFKNTGYILSVATPPYVPDTAFPAIREQQLHLPIWEWEWEWEWEWKIAETRARAIAEAEAEAELKAITELIEKASFSERSGIPEGYQPEMGNRLERHLLYGMQTQSLPAISPQEVDRLLPEFN